MKLSKFGFLILASFLHIAAWAQLGVELPKAPQAQSNNGPDLKETTDWITNKLNIAFLRNNDYNMRVKQTATFKDCEYTFDRSDMDKSELETRHSGVLQDLDVNTARVKKDFFFKPNPFILNYHTLGDQENIKFFYAYNGVGNTKTSWVEFMQPDEDSIESMKNAMLHAVKLCKAKAVAEKLARPRTKDLF